MVEDWQKIVFAAIGVVMAVAGFRVVTAKNVVHAALYLVATLLGAAALYILLLAEFVAWVQVLVYVGAIVVLMLFGLMLTRAPLGGHAHVDNDQRWLAALCAGAVFAVTSWIMYDAFKGREIELGDVGTSTRSVGEAIFSSFVLPFEVVSVLLLAALVGAVVIARRDERPVRKDV